jgi:hypothetical protein
MSSVPRYWRYIFALTAALACTAAEKVENRDLNFRVTVADGFEPADAKMAGDNDLYLFFRSQGDPARSRTAIRITRLRGTLPPGMPMEGFTKHGTRFEVEPVTWKSHTLRRARTTLDTGGQRVVVLNVQVPLTPEAIAVIVAGPEGDEKELSTLLLDVLASLDGETDWVNTPSGTTTPKREAANSAVTRDAFICLAIVAVIGFVIYVRRRGRRIDAAG